MYQLLAPRMSSLVVLIVLAVVAAAYTALRYMTSVPGKPYHGPLPPLTSEEASLESGITGKCDGHHSLGGGDGA